MLIPKNMLAFMKIALSSSKWQIKMADNQRTWFTNYNIWPCIFMKNQLLYRKPSFLWIHFIRNGFLKSAWIIGGKPPRSVNITVKTGYAYSILPIFTNFSTSMSNFAWAPCLAHDNCYIKLNSLKQPNDIAKFHFGRDVAPYLKFYF